MQDPLEPVAAGSHTEAELRSAFERERVEAPEELLSALTWVFPNRALTDEYREVLEYGYLRGADLFHLGCALYLRAELEDLAFVSVDHRQRQVPRSLGM